MSNIFKICLTALKANSTFINPQTRSVSSNGRHYGAIFFMPEKNLEFFRLKNCPIDAYPGKLE